ncbi:MAG: hypothetical protein FD127_2896, partial [Acidimicrobiaceae bacterium]
MHRKILAAAWAASLLLAVACNDEPADTTTTAESVTDAAGTTDLAGTTAATTA